MITYYETFLTSKKDPLNLMKKSSAISLAEQVAAEDIEQELSDAQAKSHGIQQMVNNLSTLNLSCAELFEMVKG